MSNKLRIGMNCHRWGAPYASYPKEMVETNLDTCKELGLDMIRFNQSCHTVEDIDCVSYFADEALKRGMTLMHVIDDGTWKNPSDTVKTEELEKYYEDYMYRISSRLKGKIEVYQVFNEMDVTGMRGDIANIILPGKDGKEKGEYDSVMFDRAIVAVRGALKGIKKGDPGAKTCVNFAWWHTAMIYAMYDAGCRFDVVGLDWYSDCEDVSSIDLVIDDVKKHIPDSDFMICETNFWMHPMGRDPIEKQEALKVDEKRYEGQAKWVPEFIQKVIDLNEPKMKAIFFYELMDEPIFERQRGSYHGESHFGFIACDEDGTNQVKKPAFYSLKKKIEEIKK